MYSVSEAARQDDVDGTSTRRKTEEAMCTLCSSPIATLINFYTQSSISVVCLQVPGMRMVMPQIPTTEQLSLKVYSTPVLFFIPNQTSCILMYLLCTNIVTKLLGLMRQELRANQLVPKVSSELFT